MPTYFLRVSLVHQTFTIPSLLSIAQTFGFAIRFLSPDLHRGIIVVELDNERDMEHLLDRGVIVISAHLLYAHATSYDDLHAQLRARGDRVVDDADKSFRISVDACNNNIMDRRFREIVRSFPYLELRGKIDLKAPEVEYVVMEDYDVVTEHSHESRLLRDGHFRDVYFGKKVGVSRARPLITAHSIKTRAYYGTTSMEAEMGFLTATQALPAPGKIIYDPFVGTGSLLYAAAHWGAYVIGSDIDGRQMRGKQKGKDVVPGIIRAAEQYGVADKFLALSTFDVAQHPWRLGGWLDAIVTDPPYGVRAGAKRIGKADKHRTPMRDEPFIMPDGTPSHLKPTYLPPFKPYGLVALTRDLILLARYLLVPGGRLVFFLPTVTDEYDDVDIPVVGGMRELKVGDGSVQNFGHWGRRLITMEKTAADDGPPPTFDDGAADLLAGKEPGHHDFAKKYMKGWRPTGPKRRDTFIWWDTKMGRQVAGLFELATRRMLQVGGQV
ncbi:hypothetical protein Q5752_006392 [Cryptotrichosporon argae]